jgi:NADPH:quinone reductase
LAEGGVVVYGAATAVGAFVIKLLVRADVHPIFAVAGRGIPFVEGIVDKSKGDIIIDYREGNDKVVEKLKAATPNGKKLLYAYDAVSEHNSYQNIVQALDPEGHLTLVLPGKQYAGIPESIKQTITMVGTVHGQPTDLSDLGFAWFKLFGQGLKEGWFSGHPYEVVSGGLDGVQTGLQNLMDGKASAIKYVYQIADAKA